MLERIMECEEVCVLLDELYKLEGIKMVKEEFTKQIIEEYNEKKRLLTKK